MNVNDPKFNCFALVHEMLDTARIVGEFDCSLAGEAAQVVRDTGKLFLTGEGSSRIFPAKNLMCQVLRQGIPLAVVTEGARQAHEYDLSDFAVFGASNSGKTKELISLFTKLAGEGHTKRFGLTATSPSPLETASSRAYTLSCGPEKAVAATKSVVEQALFYCSLLEAWQKEPSMAANQQQACLKAKEVLEMELDPALVQTIARAPVVVFGGPHHRRGGGV
jgi:glucosamine--fructose-6-phosphate aminotransferase (isomerizing)